MEEAPRSRAAARRSYRSTSTPWIAALFVVVGVVFTTIGSGAVSNPPKGGSPVVGIVGLLVGILVVAWAVGVVSRMGVTTNDEGVIVQNWIRRRSLRWDEIRGFSFGADIENLSVRELFSSPMLSTYVVLGSGRHIGLSGLSATRVNRSKSRAQVQDLLDMLDAQRLAFTGG